MIQDMKNVLSPPLRAGVHGVYVWEGGGMQRTWAAVGSSGMDLMSSKLHPGKPNNRRESF